MDGGDAVDQEERKDILHDFGVAPDHRQFSNSTELMYTCTAAQHCVIAQRDVACQSYIVGQDDVTPQTAFVGHMRMSHQEAAATNPGPALRLSSTVDGYSFTEHIPVSNLQIGRSVQEG